MFPFNIFGKSQATEPLPLEECLDGLNKWCALPVVKKNVQTKPRIQDGAFKHIQNLLVQVELNRGFHKWSCRPRIYTVLHNINEVNAMPIFIANELTDFSLPFNLETLPKALGDSRLRFIEYQEYVLTEAQELEKGIDGKHVYFPDNGNNHFHVSRKLGSGAFGHVDDVWSRLSSKSYARKRFLRGQNSRQSQENFVREITALKKLSHRHLVKVVGSYSDQECFAFLMTPVADYNLLTYLEAFKPDRLPALRTFFGCLTNAVAYLHSCQIHHLDIKAENILICNGEIYVADFGTAHDWTGKERSTTFANTPRTARYMPPEISRDPHAGRRSSTDMWSLGVVFLEMTTVLRGHSIREFRNYLTRNGTGHEYVYGNTAATYSWFEILRRSDAGPDNDNEPLTWIKDMLEADPINRPTAIALARLLLGSYSSEKFCGFCCSDLSKLDDYSLGSVDDSRSPGFEDDIPMMKLEDIWYEAVPDIYQVPPDKSVHDFKPSRTIEAWLDIGSNSTSAPQDSTVNRSASACSEVPYTIEYEDNEPTEVFHNTATPAPNLVPQRLWEFEFLGELLDEPVTNLSYESHDSVIADENSVYQVISEGSDSERSEGTIRAIHSPPELPYIYDVDEGSESSTSSPADGNLIYETIPEEPDLETLEGIVGPMISPLEPAYVNDTDQEPDIDTHSTKAIEDTLQKPNTQDTISDKNGPDLQVYESSSENHNTDQEPDFNILSIKVIEDGLQKPDTQNMMLNENGPDLQDYESSSENHSADQEPDFNTPSKKVIEDALQKPDTQNIIFNENWPDLQVCESSSENLTLSGFEAQLKQQKSARSRYRPTITVPLTFQNLEKLEPDNKEDANPKVTDTVGIDMKEANQEVEDILKPKVRFAKQPTAKKATKLTPRPSAKAYIQNVWEAESSAPTSTMFEGTRATIGLNVGWNDKTFNYLGTFATQGKAAAVRYCLEMKCNPGTQAKPRIGPVLGAVYGGSERHTKCLRLLLDYGANVNIKNPATGKTPLHYAIEHREYKGYNNLIYVLLDAGANPNVKDRNGDFPLLQLLYGGYEPLEKHKRDALALLLNYEANVNILPPGTRNMPIHLAVRRKDPWAIDMLLEKGANVNEQNGAGATPFALAVSTWNPKMTQNQQEVAEILLERGAFVDEKIGSAQNTALQIAISHGRQDIVGLLLKYKADPHATDKEGLDANAIALASLNNNQITPKLYLEMIKILSKFSDPDKLKR